jgi:hypothetical protein
MTRLLTFLAVGLIAAIAVNAIAITKTRPQHPPPSRMFTTCAEGCRRRINDPLTEHLGPGGNAGAFSFRVKGTLVADE